jgi:hypothetical protein
LAIFLADHIWFLGSWATSFTMRAVLLRGLKTKSFEREDDLVLGAFCSVAWGLRALLKPGLPSLAASQRCNLNFYEEADAETSQLRPSRRAWRSCEQPRRQPGYALGKCRKRHCLRISPRVVACYTLHPDDGAAKDPGQTAGGHGGGLSTRLGARPRRECCSQQRTVRL